VQHLRAAEPGRGREARAPTQIPRPGWKDIVLRTYQEVQDDRLLALAAGVAFYSLVALFPALAAGVSVYALFADAATIAGHLSAASNIVPAAGLDILSQEISRLAAKSDGRLTVGFLVGLAIALWSVKAGMKAIFDALNVIYDEIEKRSFIRLNQVSLFPGDFYCASTSEGYFHSANSWHAVFPADFRQLHKKMPRNQRGVVTRLPKKGFVSPGLKNGFSKHEAESQRCRAHDVPMAALSRVRVAQRVRAARNPRPCRMPAITTKSWASGAIRILLSGA
jgi:Virulence factor BrkB